MISYIKNNLILLAVIAAITSAGGMYIKGLHSDLEAKAATIASKDTTIKGLNESLERITGINAENKRKLKEVRQLYADKEIAESKLAQELNLIQEEAQSKRLALASYSHKLNNNILIKKPGLMKKRLKAATQKAFRELKEATLYKPSLDNATAHITEDYLDKTLTTI